MGTGTLNECKVVDLPANQIICYSNDIQSLTCQEEGDVGSTVEVGVGCK